MDPFKGLLVEMNREKQAILCLNLLLNVFLIEFDLRLFQGIAFLKRNLLVYDGCFCLFPTAASTEHEKN